VAVVAETPVETEISGLPARAEEESVSEDEADFFFFLPAFFAAAFFFSRFLRFFLELESESLSESELELLEESDSEDEFDEEPFFFFFFFERLRFLSFLLFLPLAIFENAAAMRSSHSSCLPSCSISYPL
jgi:hypothetical protein